MKKAVGSLMVLVCLLGFAGLLRAEDSVAAGGISNSNQNQKLNFITLDPFGFLSMGASFAWSGKIEYERGLANDFSITLQGYYNMLYTDLSQVKTTYAKYGPGLALRYYPGIENTGLTGLWFGPEGYWQTGKEELKFFNSTYNKFISHDEYSAGLGVGYKWLIGNWLAISPYAVGSYRMVKNSKISDKQFADENMLSMYGGVNVGVAF
jgi:hypothetical protein